MFCRNCGMQIDDVAAICVKCGTRKGEGTNFCGNCGREVPRGAAFCMNCGVALSYVPVGYEQKSKVAAGLLGIFLGAFGVHNFYLGNTGKGVAQLLLCFLGGCFIVGPMAAYIWGFIEGIMILTGSINKDSKGIDLKE